MRKRSGVWLLLFLFAGISLAAQRGPEKSSSGEEFVGVWSGSWQATGSSGGGFELTLEKNKDSRVVGKVSVTGEPTYKASFKTLSFDGNKLNAKYDFPPSASDAEVWLTATFDGSKADGTWSLRVKADGSEVAAGTWSVAKK